MHTVTAATLDRHGVAHPQQPFLQLQQLVAVAVLDDHGVAHAQDLVVDEERTLAVLVLDPEIVAQRQQLLAQHVAGALRRRPRARILAVSAPAPRWHLRPPVRISSPERYTSPRTWPRP